MADRLPDLDAPVPTDATPPPDGATDAAATLDVRPEGGAVCASDRDCASAMQVCDVTSGRCVDCLRDADCLGAGQVCTSNRCVTITPCTSSRMCTNQVCELTRGVCVDCVGDADCPSDRMCRANACVGATCTPGAATCASPLLRSVCNPSGAGFSTAPCTAGPNATPTCTGAGMCNITCAAGFNNCDNDPANGCESSTPCDVLIGGLGGAHGYGPPENCVRPSDDGFYAGPGAVAGSPAVAIDITPAFPMGLDYFGANHRSMYLNNNGNITFVGIHPVVASEPFPISPRPMIAPWWADVDTSRGGQPMQNNVCFVVQPNRVIVTWHLVSYLGAAAATDRRNSFQLVLTPRSENRRDFDVEFRYGRCEWISARQSDGLGLPGAKVGFDAGNLRDFFALPGSETMAVLDLCRTSNLPGGTPGVWRYQVRGGRVGM